jgi:hypothetical protein
LQQGTGLIGGNLEIESKQESESECGDNQGNIEEKHQNPSCTEHAPPTPHEIKSG